ncbi:TetR/AcrR family transcriptional regulator [Nocardia sp. CA2R105]|uniref:TetR/AcrR family transcriptional regulator n=1 Tax=Nocardia coffeae TaxID=2873381 RepID=UPI001CA73B18|nr:TetR/AcrR family transcriptional regulator [Nocardia coffeae]MBY8859307.1 TetR/AcrR family transcriptional regulator [Nocardia coffeae]
MMSRREENAAETRRALVENAARLFADQGFAGTSLDQVAVLARVTKGAVYHHFTNKQALFRAVLELVDERTVTMIASTAGSVDSPWDATLAGLSAFLDRCLDPEYQQICFRDGPTALGFVQWWEHGERHVEGVLTAALAALREDHSIVTADTDALGTALYGALTAAALTIARAEDAQQARNAMGRTMVELLEGLRPAP